MSKKYIELESGHAILLVSNAISEDYILYPCVHALDLYWEGLWD